MSSSGNSFAETGVSLFDWTFSDHKSFEFALAVNYDKADRWERIAASVPNKTPQDVHNYFLMLEDDVRRIEMGQVPVPTYEQQPVLSPPPFGGLEGLTVDTSAQQLQPVPATPRNNSNKGNKSGHNTPGSSKKNKGSLAGANGGVSKHSRPLESLVPPPPPATGGVASPGAPDRRKGVPWTEDEHRLFLLGLAKFGKGDWRSIARNFVTTRTPTQVASHAQKYFIRLNSSNKKDKRRASIHDITSASLTPLDLQRGHSGSLDQQHDQQQPLARSAKSGSKHGSKHGGSRQHGTRAATAQQTMQHTVLLPPLPPMHSMGGGGDDEEEDDDEDNGLAQHHLHHQHSLEEEEEGDDSIGQQQHHHQHQHEEQQEDVGFGEGGSEEQDEVGMGGGMHNVVSDMVDEDDEPAMHHHHYPLHHHFEGMIMPELIMMEQDAY